MKKLFIAIVMLLCCSSSWGSTYGVFIGDSFTANGSAVAKLLTYSGVESIVNTGVQGDTLANMATRLSTSALAMYTGPNLLANGEFTSNITGWTRLSATGDVTWDPSGKLKLTNTTAANASMYSPAITVTPNTTYEITINWSTYGGLTSLNTWIGITGNPFNNTVMTSTSVTRPFRKTFTTGASVSTIYIGFQNAGAIQDQYSMLDSIGIRAIRKPLFVNIEGGINDINTGGATLSSLQTNMTSILTAIKAANIVPIAWNIAPYGTMLQAKRDLVDSYNVWLREYCTTNKIYMIDQNAILANPSNPQGLNPIYDSGDGLHPNTLGYETIVTTYGAAPYNFALIKSTASTSTSKILVDCNTSNASNGLAILAAATDTTLNNYTIANCTNGILNDSTGLIVNDTIYQYNGTDVLGNAVAVSNNSILSSTPANLDASLRPTETSPAKGTGTVVDGITYSSSTGLSLKDASGVSYHRYTPSIGALSYLKPLTAISGGTTSSPNLTPNGGTGDYTWEIEGSPSYISITGTYPAWKIISTGLPLSPKATVIKVTDKNTGEIAKAKFGEASSAKKSSWSW